MCVSSREEISIQICCGRNWKHGNYMAIAVVQLRASEGSERVGYIRSENEDECKGEGGKRLHAEVLCGA